MAQQARRRPTAPLDKTTIRDFGGGLNVIDDELNLTSRYSPVLDNMVRYGDGSRSPRFGYEAWWHKKSLIAQTTHTFANVAWAAAVNTYVLTMTYPIAHGLTNDNHITLSGITGVNPSVDSWINGTHAIRVVNATQIALLSPYQLPAITVTTTPASFIKDNDALGGTLLRVIYFQGRLILYSSTGEIGTLMEDKTFTKIWSPAIAFGLPSPVDGWRPWLEGTSNLAHTIWGKALVMSDGINKPIDIIFTRANPVLYVVDPGNAFSNSLVPPFDLVKSAFRYFVIHDKARPTEIRIAAKNTNMVFVGAPSPGDAVDIEISKITATADLDLTGLAILKGQLMVITPTATIMLTLGAYPSAGIHEPTIADVLSNFGSSAPRSVIEIGTDVFMLDYNGIPSARLSSVSGSIVPERVSQLIEPAITAHLGRLTAATIRSKAFAVYDGHNKFVQFYLPKYDATDTRRLDSDPITIDASLNGTSHVYLRVRDHKMEVGDFVDFVGLTTAPDIPDVLMNGRSRIIGVFDPDNLLIDTGYTLTGIVNPKSLGGVNGYIKPVNDQNIAYIYHYVPALRIQAWSRFKMMNLNGGCSTTESRTFYVTDEYVMRYGTTNEPVYGDWVGQYDVYDWTPNTTYTNGIRVYDANTGTVWRANSTHVSANVTDSATAFTEARVNASSLWSLDEGEPINVAWELPWADFGTRQNVKALKHIHIDAEGTDHFQVKLFADNIYKNRLTGALSPLRSMQFVGGDALGFGGTPGIYYGTGRSTQEQVLWTIPLKFKILKLRFEAQVTKPLRISAISFLFQRGGLIR